MKLLKFLILILSICSFSFSSDFGLKAQLTNSSHIGIGGGAGILGLVNITNAFAFYPSFDFWYNGSGDGGEYWDGYDWVYVEDWYSTYEFAFNLDMAVLLPIRPVQPYMGFGLAPIITTDSDPYDSYTNTNIGFNVFGGILFPMGYSTSGMFEIRGKLGKPYNVLKIGIGLLFEPHLHYYHHHHHGR